MNTSKTNKNKTNVIQFKAVDAISGREDIRSLMNIKNKVCDSTDHYETPALLENTSQKTTFKTTFIERSDKKLLVVTCKNKSKRFCTHSLMYDWLLGSSGRPESESKLKEPVRGV